jgi:hypothetical protein
MLPTMPSADASCGLTMNPRFLSRSTTYGEETARRRLVVMQLQNASKDLLLTRPQAGNWVEDGSGALVGAGALNWQDLSPKQ